MCHKWRSYDVWFLRYKAQWIEFFVILGYLFPLDTLNNSKIKILKKWKKHLEISYFTLVYHNDNHMIYGSWDMEYNRQNFLSFWAIFCPFNLLTTQKIFFEIMKKLLGDIIILHIRIINENLIMYDSWDMEYDRHNFSHSGTFFALSPLP